MTSGGLTVNDYESPKSQPIPSVSNSSLPDMRDSEYMLGGTEPNWKPPSFLGDLPPPFLGCLGDITIEATNVNPTDTRLSYGIENSCSNKVQFNQNLI